MLVSLIDDAYLIIVQSVEISFFMSIFGLSAFYMYMYMYLRSRRARGRLARRGQVGEVRRARNKERARVTRISINK
jgi:hypothetical protein